MSNRIDISLLIEFLEALRDHSYEAIGGNGESIHGFDSTTVSFDAGGHFLCYTTVSDGVLYSFYNDLILQSDRDGVQEAIASDFDFLNGRLEAETRELKYGPSFD